MASLNKKQKSAEALLAGKIEELKARYIQNSVCSIDNSHLQSLADEAAMLEQQLNKKLAQSEKVMAELAKLAELETPENKDDLQASAVFETRASYCNKCGCSD